MNNVEFWMKKINSDFLVNFYFECKKNNASFDFLSEFCEQLLDIDKEAYNIIELREETK